MSERRAQGGGEGDDFSRSLLALRKAVRPKLSQTAAGAQAGLNQRTMSRIEAGLYLPTRAELDALLRQYQPTEEEAQTLRDTLAARLAAPPPKRFYARAGHVAAIQRRAGLLEKAAQVIEAFQPAGLIGLVQCPEYMRALFNRPEVADAEEAIAERVARKREALESGKRIVLVHTEGALRNMIGNPETMAAQCDYLARLAREESALLVGIIPFWAALPGPMMSGFRLYDRATLSVSSATGELFPPDVVEEYGELFDQITEVAEFGDPAAEEFERIAADYRRVAAHRGT